jgi:hypothetical protein
MTWYGGPAGHRIRIYRDYNERPWVIIFDELQVVFLDGKPLGSVVRYPEERERTADAAKTTAEALARARWPRHPKTASSGQELDRDRLV